MMKLIDPQTLKLDTPADIIIFSGSQLQGPRETQEDFFVNFNDECFVVTDGVGGLPNGNVAARLGAETAIWGYKHIRQRPFYWEDKKLLLKRIFRSANLAVWQKRSEFGFEAGLATTLAVAIVGTYKIWVGTVGDSNVLLFRDGLIDVLTPSDVDEMGMLTNALGMRRLGLVPHIAIERFLPGDILVLATDGVLQYVNEEQLRLICESTANTTESLSDAVIKLLHAAEDNGSTDNMTACMVKKIRVVK